MPGEELHRGDKFIRKRRLRSRWYKAMVVLSSIVVFCTTYALILPAVTMEKGCQIPEHAHGEACYETRMVQVLDCKAAAHSHTEACRDENGEYICGYADFLVHTHDESCLDGEGNLICTLPEIKAHTHEESCYVLRKHTHDDACYEKVAEELLCQEPEIPAHHHDDHCSGQVQELTCGQEETAGHTHGPECYCLVPVLSCGLADHTHGDGCFDEEGNPICGQETHTHGDTCWTEEQTLACGQAETPEHSHNGECYTLVQLVCDKEETEGHAHGDDCWEWSETLICDVPAEEWVPLCGKQEIIPHTHGDTCFDETGNLVCGMVEVLVHVHDESCCREEERQVLTCTQEAHTHGETCQSQEEGSAYYCGKEVHTHGETCVDEAGTVICELEEHTHTDECQIPPETEPEPAYTCGKEPHTHEETCYDEAGSVICGKEEHVHTDECLPKTYYCGREEHTHEDTCLNEAGERVCGLTAHTHIDRCLLPIPYCGKEEHTHGEGCFDEEGVLICLLEQHTHTLECCQPTLLTEEELQALVAELTEKVDALEALESLTDEDITAAQELMERLEEAYRQRWLEEETYLALYTRLEALLLDAYQSIAEPCYGNNWLLLRDSGWFYEYSGIATASYALDEDFAVPYAALEGDDSPSSVQVDEPGGTNSGDGVTVSKTITGTDLENVFDITLTVQTPQRIDEVIEEPDMAVVIVMDISNTMTTNFGDSTRYKAAMDAAEDFLDKFAESNSLGVSKIGYVAFNTDAHQIFGLQPCTNPDQANTLKNTMRTATGRIINANGYASAPNRFTNVEGGLKMARDMLAGVKNKSKFIIFLSDGFPTTYISEGYYGCDTYDSNIFYDYVLDVGCYGTSYSNTAAIKAREMAASIKGSGITIFSIGVDVGGQTIEKYVKQSEDLGYMSVVERKDTNYEIGDASSTSSYKNWLKNSIGSGYYYDSTNTAGLINAYDQILAEIKTTIETATEADWVASDPIPSITPDEIDFIGLFDKNGTLQGDFLKGTHAENEEDTASYGDSTITWDLKESGYTTTTSGSTTTYTYELKYRIRLRNEDGEFAEGKIYNTNGKTTLDYRLVESVNGTLSISESRTIEFPIPSVHGYLGELTFTKVDNRGNHLNGVEFTLQHATSCDKCRGDGSRVTIADRTATSDAAGSVKFEKIPSGHTYTLTEKVPPGYSTGGYQYTVTIAYDEVTVKVTDSSGKTEIPWEGTIVNYTSYELPNTGGPGTTAYTLGGTALALSAALLLYNHRKRRRGEDSST